MTLADIAVLACPACSRWPSMPRRIKKLPFESVF